jgi:hypothetical protein
MFSTVASSSPLSSSASYSSYSSIAGSSGEGSGSSGSNADVGSSANGPRDSDDSTASTIVGQLELHLKDITGQLVERETVGSNGCGTAAVGSYDYGSHGSSTVYCWPKGGLVSASSPLSSLANNTHPIAATDGTNDDTSMANPLRTEAGGLVLGKRAWYRLDSGDEVELTLHAELPSY